MKVQLLTPILLKREEGFGKKEDFDTLLCILLYYMPPL